MQIVTEKTPLNGDIIGLNIFGRTGNYGHIILKKHDKMKKKIYAKDEMFDDGLPRLILVSGRSDTGVRKTMKTVHFSKLFTHHQDIILNVFLYRLKNITSTKNMHRYYIKYFPKI